MLTAAQLAAALGISERQVNRLVNAGLPSTPVGARGGAQALWDKETAEAEAFRAAHPAP